MTPTRIELVLPPWKGDVLTAWPRSLIYFAESLSDINNFSIDIYKYQVLFLISFIFCNFTVPVRIKHTFYKKQKKTCSFYCRSAPRVGLEPTTLRLTAECSTIELSRITKACAFKTAYRLKDLQFLLQVSSPSWARTNNPSVNSRMLYHWAIEDHKGMCLQNRIQTKRPAVFTAGQLPELGSNQQPFG